MAYVKGDLVFADTGWQEYAAVNARTVQKLPRIEPLSHLLSVYGIAGLTAYFGLLNVGKPKAGETVVVSAAAGSVGVFVGQIAKLKGCRVVGIAGGPKKCDWLKSELGFDEVIDYKAEAVAGGAAEGLQTTRRDLEVGTPEKDAGEQALRWILTRA